MDQTPGAMDEDQVLAYTQGKRKYIVDGLTRENKIPTDRLEATLLMHALDGLDKAALTSKRIKSDEKAAAGFAGASNIIAQLLMQAGSRRSDDAVDAQTREVPLLGDEVSAPALVPGETEINPPQMDYDSFVANFQSNSNPSSDSDA